MINYKNFGKDPLERFVQARDFLIRELEAGRYNKQQFLLMNYDMIQQLGIKSYSPIRTIEEGLFNYQYYNILAKFYTMKLQECRQGHLRSRHFKKYKDLANNYYHEKDLATEKMLDLVNFQGVEAYFIEVNSSSLKGSVFEIHFRELDKVILHSKSSKLLEALKRAGVFSSECRRSLIDSYINERY